MTDTAILIAIVVAVTGILWFPVFILWRHAPQPPRDAALDAALARIAALEENAERANARLAALDTWGRRT